MPADSLVHAGDVTIHVRVAGRGSLVVLFPSGGRGATDFDGLARDLADAGYTSVAVNPRGVGGSTGPLTDLSLHDYAADMAAVIEAFGGDAAHVIGHAFGNRVVRCLAVDSPEHVRSVALLAAGGRVQSPEPGKQPAIPIAATLSDDQLEGLRRRGFLSPATSPEACEWWRTGWWPDALRAQATAVFTTSADEWWTAGQAPVLIIQGLDDGVAPPENGRLLKQEIGDRGELVELSGAGHALLNEQPASIFRSITDFLERVERRAGRQIQDGG